MNIRILLIFFLCFSLCSKIFAAEGKFYKVIKITDGDTCYIDFNFNGFPDADERVRINGIDTMETKLNERLYWQALKYNLTKKEVLGAGFLATEFAQKNLQGKNVHVIFSADKNLDIYNRNLVSIYYDYDKNGICKNYEKEILKAGLAVVYSKSNIANQLYQYEDINKLINNAKNSKTLDLAFVDVRTNKYHSLDCKNISEWKYMRLVKKPLIRLKYDKCCKKEKDGVI